MKNNLFVFAFALLSTTLLFNSCSKEETKPSATTGGLKVLVKLVNSTGFITDADVAIATSKANFDNGIALAEKTTDSKGVADFGQLNPGNYYIGAQAFVGSDDYFYEGQVQISAGTNLELTIELE